jgi:hypothetical protein
MVPKMEFAPSKNRWQRTCFFSAISFTEGCSKKAVVCKSEREPTAENQINQYLGILSL